ncbi:MAG: peptide chain release factor N(5)-glutamine methyltransferase [Candidatus Omnitrophota bacterium]
MLLADTHTIVNVLRFAETRLRSSGIISARNDAEKLLLYLLGIERAKIFEYEELKDTVVREYLRLLEQRARRTPLQYLIGSCSFMGIELKVREGVFIPRPETEILTNEILELLKGLPCPHIADIGTGTGNIAISLTKFLQNCRILAIDNSEAAIALAQENALMHQVDGLIRFELADITGDSGGYMQEKFNVIISNPPYIERAVIETLQPEIRHEPSSSLDGGLDGLLFYRTIAKKAESLLSGNGIVAFEIGFSQAQAVSAILKRNSFNCVHVIQDLNGLDRVIIAQRE